MCYVNDIVLTRDNEMHAILSHGMHFSVKMIVLIKLEINLFFVRAKLRLFSMSFVLRYAKIRMYNLQINNTA